MLKNGTCFCGLSVATLADNLMGGGGVEGNLRLLKLFLWPGHKAKRLHGAFYLSVILPSV